LRTQLHSAASARTLRTTLAGGGHKLVSLPDNLVDRVWADARPAPPRSPMRVHALRWAGVSVVDKLASVRAEMSKAGADVLVVAQLDEVAWLLNVRGADVDYNPVTLAYALVHADGAAALYCDASKVTPDVAAQLAAAHVTVRPYVAAAEDLRAAAAAGRRVWADPAKVSLALFDAVDDAAGEGAVAARAAKARRRGDSNSGKKAASPPPSAPGAAARPPPLLESASPIAMAKAVKNGAELEGMREAHLRDAVALATFFAWLEASLADGAALTEASAAAHLTSLRAAQEGFVEPSFPTIAGCGPNGAVIHYRPLEGLCAALSPGSLLLLDSGGQYDCGTTDVTRTVHLGHGEPSAAQRDAFTRVLQGHIALDTAVFPEGTPGFVLDAFARRPLWAAGLDYRHGTGHGVGAALNVHEGPHGISPRFGNLTGLVAGMVVSNEPGMYFDGAWGIRIENLLALREAPTASRFGGVTFLGFERLTLVPIQAKMLAHELLSAAELAWLDEYHAQVWDAVSPRCSGAARDWLRANTTPLASRLPAAASK
jgi:Xaa-Pro aminopeptidase